VPNSTGDIGYLCKIPFGKQYLLSLEKNYLSSFRVDTFSFNSKKKYYQIATIGDSFSQQDVYGYQNYLYLLEDEKIINFKRRNDSGLSPEQMAINHLKSDNLNDLNIKIVIVESVERYFIQNLNNLCFDSIVIEPKRPLEKGKSLLEKVTQWVRFSIWDRNENPVKKANLNDYYFKDSKNGNKLFFYKDDLAFTAVSTKEIREAKIKLIKMKELFESKGLKLIYFVAADKYNVYQSFIENNPYPKNKIMENFKEFDKMEFFFNSNNILYPMVQKGVKDDG
jgi:hypothetical protein